LLVCIADLRRPMLSRKAILGSMWALAFLSYMVYGHHLFVSGMNPFSSLAFSFSHVADHHSIYGCRPDLDR
jgi:cytochrome c oxidase subunit I